MTDQRTDGVLVADILSGRPEALTILLGRYEAGAVRYACSIVGDRDDAEDVVQTASIKAYRNLRAFDQHRPFQPWLYRIIRNEAFNWIRNHRRTVYGEGAQLLLENTPSQTDTHADIEKTEIQTMIRQCLFQLPLNYREPLMLYYLDDRTYQEISDILRLPLGTVGTNINRGKQQLRRLVEAQGSQ
ncbi:RNA polymerase sigma factor [Candidatus Berkelbacteria bacterium]|nr:RNA polymerase sigma factor [Candidatus Berkelbacteria bacterium]